MSVIKQIVLISFSLHAMAQNLTKPKGYHYNNNYDLGISGYGMQYLTAMSWTKFHGFGEKERFKLGYGLRFNSQFGKQVNYVTAPADLTSGESGPQVIFTENINENIDTLFVSNAQHNSLNIAIHFQYTIRNTFDVGLNIDLLGFTFGAATTGKYMAYQSTENLTIQKASPTPYNLLLISDNDIGMLNSELYIRYWFKQNWGLKLGVSFLFTEYTTENKLRLDNDRWRSKTLLGLIGLTYSPFK